MFVEVLSWDMSVIPHGLNRLLQFYLSGPLPCPYLPNQVERKLFTKLTGRAVTDRAINSILTREGFRRSHDLVYRPACPSCSACVPVRIPVKDFSPSRSLRRIAANNRDLVLNAVEPKATDEMFQLFIRYQLDRHSDSDMSRMTREDFDSMLQEGETDTTIYQLRDKISGDLLGAMITDKLRDGFSAVYSFFDPTSNRKSLGVQLILSLVSEAKREELPFVYLGYWIKEARKMAYKTRFSPLQALGLNGWEEKISA